MCAKRFCLLAVLFYSLLLLPSCGKQKDDVTAPTRWGKENCYNKFLWKKHIPDTLYRTVVFDFNEDAQNYMGRPLRLGLYKKTESGKMLPVTETEMEVFVEKQKCPNNVIDVNPGTDQLNVGIVFKPQADNKVHHWFFKPVDDAGLDRINDLDNQTFNSSNASLMELEVEKNLIINPLRLIVRIIWITLLILLAIWLLFLKRMVYPYFGVGRITLSDPEPYMKQINLRKYRKYVFTKRKDAKQSWFARLFTGQIGYDINSLWDSDIVLEPRNRKSVRVSFDKNVFYIDGRTLSVGNVYTVENLNTKAKTKLEI